MCVADLSLFVLQFLGHNAKNISCDTVCYSWGCSFLSILYSIRRAA